MIGTALAVAVATACGGGSATTAPAGPAVVTVTVAPNAPVLAVGTTQQLTATARDVNGNPVTGRTVTWISNVPAVANVSPSGLVSALTAGTASIFATVDAVAGSSAVTTLATPVLSAVNPTMLVPGTVATVSGLNFETTIANDTVTVQGVTAAITSATPTQLTFVVPCVASGAVGVRVRTRVGPSSLVNATAQGTPRTIALGQAYITVDATSTGCTELTTSGAPARYLVAVFSDAGSQNTLTDFDISGNPNGVVPDGAPPAAAQRALPPGRAAPGTGEAGEVARFEAAHLAFLERDRRWYETQRPRDRTLRLRAATPARAVVVGDMRGAYYTFGGGCADSTQVIRAKAIYVGARSIIWEDSANTVQSAVTPSVAGYYQRIGQLFDGEQYQSDSANFGDPLRRDAQLDGDGKVQMVFTQRLNGSGAAAYVTSCDQFLRGGGANGSNFGEFFYGFVPTTITPNLGSTAAPDGWFAFMTRTVAHEVKHIVSMSARVANNAPSLEQSWLEEGTARQAEEMWVRSRIHFAAWKANTGFGTAATNGLYCDFTLGDPTCLANDATHRPAWGMRRQFDEILPKLQQPWNWSPYGDGSGQSGAIFYNTTWSLVRYAIDRYGASDAAFLTALTDASTTGVANLTARAGVSIDQLLGGWGLALYADDYPGLAAPSPDTQFATWNLRSIYGGLAAHPQWSARYPTAYPVAPSGLSFGSFIQRVVGVRGGAHMLFELQGTPTTNQLISIVSTAGDGSVPPSLRIAITRLQ